MLALCLMLSKIYYAHWHDRLGPNDTPTTYPYPAHAHYIATLALNVCATTVG